MSKLFVSGISTDVGKTIVSAILAEALEADYWKPIQAGDLTYCDTRKVKELVSNKRTKFHPNSFALKTPMSPHAAAEIDKVAIKLEKIKEPKTKNNLIIEGAGGLLVPINDSDTIIDLIKDDYKVVLVSRHYLGSINHSLLSIECLKKKGCKIFLIFNGDEHKSTESIIKKMSGVKVIGRLEVEPYFDKNVIKEYADIWKPKLKELL